MNDHMRGTIKAYLSSWKVRASFAVATVFALVSALVAINSTVDNATSIWQRIQTAYTLAATPFVGLLMLAAVLIVAIWGWKDVVEAQRLGNQVDQLAQARETEIRAEAMAAVRHEIECLREDLKPQFDIVNLVGEVVAYDRHYEGIRRNLEMARKSIAAAEPLALDFEIGRNISFSNISMALHPIYGAHDVLARTAASLDTNIPQQSLVEMIPNPTPTADDMKPYMVYDPTINGLFAQNVKLNIEVIQANHRAVEQRLGQLEAALSAKKDALWSKFSGTPI